jgi:hypothetical protein
MADHSWVEMKYTPVEVEQRPDGTLDVHATEAALEIADEEAKYGCWFCFTPLDSDTFGTGCDYQPVEHGASEGDRQG